MKTQGILAAITFLSTAIHYAGAEIEKAVPPALPSVKAAIDSYPPSLLPVVCSLGRLYWGMSEAETMRVLALEKKANLLHVGCAHSWINCYTPVKGYDLVLSFTEGGFAGACLTDPLGMWELWPQH